MALVAKGSRHLPLRRWGTSAFAAFLRKEIAPLFQDEFPQGLQMEILLWAAAEANHWPWLAAWEGMARPAHGEALDSVALPN
jgi:hypothetical protein